MITQANGKLKIKTPYNQAFVNELKAMIPWQERNWNRREKTWEVDAKHEEVVSGLVARFFGKAKEYEIINAIISGGNSYKRTYPGGVTVDGHDLITSWGAISRDTDAFQILEWSGGYTRGDGRHAHDWEFTVKVRCRKDATWETFGRGNHRGWYKILSKEAV